MRPSQLFPGGWRGALLYKIYRYGGKVTTRLSLKLSPLVFVRSHTCGRLGGGRSFASLYEQLS